MKLPYGVKLSKVLSKVPMRPALHGVMVRHEKIKRRTYNGEEEADGLVLYATNSVAFVRIETPQEDGDVEGPIPREALLHMERGVHAKLGEDQIKVGRIAHYDRVISEELPDAPSDRFPSYAEIEDDTPLDKNLMRLGLSPVLLKEVAEAMGALKEGVEIVLDLDKLKPMERGHKGRWYNGQLRVRPMPKSGYLDRREALVMPMRIYGGL